MRAVLCILALGIDTAGAFHASRPVTTGWARNIELKMSYLDQMGGAPPPGPPPGGPPPGGPPMGGPPPGPPMPMGVPPTSAAVKNTAYAKEIRSKGASRTGSAPFTAGGISNIARAAPPPSAESSVLVQGGSLRTWSYRSPMVEQVQVVLSTEGRPLDADIELWHGPDNTPCKMRVYVENGQLRPFSAVIETPRSPNTVAIRNIGQLEFPFAADVYANDVEGPSIDCVQSSATIQGGALRTYPFDPQVDSVQVLLKTDGRPLHARIELLQGPNNNKQVVELYTEDGFDRPFFAILETPGSGNVVRIVNTAPVEFPMSAGVVPGSINTDMSLDGDVVIGGDSMGW